MQKKIQTDKHLLITKLIKIIVYYVSTNSAKIYVVTLHT